MSELLDTFEILPLLRDKLASDADIIEYCVENFGKRHKVFLDVDSRNLPRKDEYPIIVIFDIERDEKGDSDNMIKYHVNIAAAIIQPLKTQVKAQDNVTVISETQEGKIQVEELRRLIEAAVFDARIATKTDVLGATYKDDIYPLFRTDTQIQLCYKRSSRRGFR